MNKFRLFEDHRKNARHEQMQLITLLDKCTQILREDRIYIRNKIKEGDQQVLSFFKPSKHLNMQQLQINLRRYLNQLKANLKMQQLIKFKETYVDSHCSCEKTKQSVSSTANCTNKPKQPCKEININTNFQELFPKNARGHSKEQRSSSLSHLHKGHTDKKVSALGKPPLNSKKCASTTNLHRLPAYSVGHEGQQPFFTSQDILGHARKRSTTAGGSGTASKHSRSGSSHALISKAEENKNTQSASKENRGHMKSMEQPSVNGTYGGSKQGWERFNAPRPAVQPLFQKEFNANDASYYRNQQQYESIYQSTQGSAYNKYRNSSVGVYDNLFTPPQLLKQCRKYIEKHKSPLSSFPLQDLSHNYIRSLKPVTVVSPVADCEPIVTYSKPTESVNMSIQSDSIKPIEKCYPEIKNDPATVQQNITPTKQLPSVPVVQTIQESVQITLDSQTETERYPNRERENLVTECPNLSDYYAEDIVDILFYNRDGAWISGTDYAYTVYSNFADTVPFERLFQVADPNKQGRINVEQLGNILSKIAKCKQNAAKDFFSLIDLDRTGRVTEEEYYRFLSQIRESQEASFEEVRDAAEKIFSYADFNNSGEITYWSVYLIKNTWEFQEFSAYLEQFEFSIEP